MVELAGNHIQHAHSFLDNFGSNAVAGEKSDVEVQMKSPISTIGDVRLTIVNRLWSMVSFVRHHQSIFQRISEGAPAGFDDVCARTDCAPARGGIARVD